MNVMLRETLRRRWSRLGYAGVLALLPLVPLRAQTNTAAEGPPPAPRRPCIVLILADNIGYGDLGCYGQQKIKTPGLDKLAGGGIRFTSFYAGSPDDAPSRAALLTGMEPNHIRAGFNQPLAPDALTLAAFLRQYGYHTALIGEWNLGDTGPARPDKRGFDEFAGFLSQGHAHDYFTDRWWRHDPATGNDGQFAIFENVGGKQGRYLPDLLTTAALNFVGNHKPDQFNGHRPFFLCLAYPVPAVTGNSSTPTDPQYSDEPWPPLERTRATMISRMDEGIGRLLNKLEELGISTNTAVFFTSVNGPRREERMDPEFFNSTGPLRGWQGSVHEGGLRVPMIVRWPAQITPGRTSDFVWAAWDLLPTAANIALAKRPEKIDGISVLPVLLAGTQTNRHEVFYWESRERGFEQAARMGDWKALRPATNAPLELYDLKTDAGEKQDVAEKHPDVRAKLEKILSATGAKADPPRTNATDKSADQPPR
jgi:arylsulfatase A-like enzyme